MSKKIKEAVEIIKKLGLPKAQHNDRTALCLLSLLNLSEDRPWGESENPLLGITPMMSFAKDIYNKAYAPNSRETFRRFSIHQMVDAGIVKLNPDDPKRPVNSPNNKYQIDGSALDLLRTYGTDIWEEKLKEYLAGSKTLAAKYAKEREMHKIPVQISEGMSITLSPGDHSQLIKDIISQFAPRFAPGSTVVYVGDTGDKWGYFDEDLLKELNVAVDSHGKMPDVVLYFKEKNWLLLIESVTSHGPVDGKRHDELARLFKTSKAPLVYVTAFPSRSVMSPYLGVIAWETEVWCADAPTHLIHFNGERFLGPYE